MLPLAAVRASVAAAAAASEAEGKIGKIRENLQETEGRQKLVGTATEHWTPAKGNYNTVVSTARCESLTGVGSQQFVDDGHDDRFAATNFSVLLRISGRRPTSCSARSGPPGRWLESSCTGR